LMEKIGIDHRQKWSEFEAEVEKIKDGKMNFLTWDDSE